MIVARIYILCLFSREKKMKKNKIWTVKEVLDWTVRYLTEKGIPTPRQDVEYILSFVLKTSRLKLYMQMDKPMTPKELALFKKLVKRRLNREPLQYITGIAYLWKYEFLVEKGVFIPRRDTETLIEVTLHFAKKMSPEIIADVGTGTGCVLLSILKETTIPSGIGIDISKKALEVFKKNAYRMGIASRTKAVRGDMLSFVKPESLDIIVSNPPYVKSDEIEKLQEEILWHEPKEALDGGRDGLFFIRRLVKEAFASLKKGGFFATEVGYDQAEAVKFLLKKAGFSSIETARDLAGVERVVSGWKH